MRSEEIHARLGSRWALVLEQLGVDRKHLTKRQGPCPICGGKDRFRFDNKFDRGNWFCNVCGSDDGFALLMRMHRWSFEHARQRVLAVAGFQSSPPTRSQITPSVRPDFPAMEISKPTDRVLELIRNSVPLELCPDVIRYLAGRGLWPLSPGHSLRAHPHAQYWDRRPIGHFPSVVAEVRDVAGELVTVGVIYTQHGRKLNVLQPKKLLSKMQGRRGCAVRIFPADGNALGIAEGVETAIAAHQLFRTPVWAAWSASMLAGFEPPAGIARLSIFADHDDAGIKAARTLADRLQERVRVEILVPPRPGADWADFLLEGGDAAAAAKTLSL